MLSGWHTILSERGSIMRVRDRCFAAWKVYAPRRRRLRYLVTSLNDWQILCVKAKAYRAMTMSCKGKVLSTPHPSLSCNVSLFVITQLLLYTI